MSRLKNLTGLKFGRLTVIELAENATHGQPRRWKCLCECGKISIVATTELTRGKTKSCGCLNVDKLFKHGMKNTSIYHRWKDIKQRCFNPNCKSYPNYGGRGITICDEWKNDFLAFYNYVSMLEHFGEEGYTLDRIDNNGNYEPSNLRWTDRKTQRINQRRTIFVEYNGEKMCLKYAAEKSGISKNVLLHRYKRGDRGERLFRPVKKH